MTRSIDKQEFYRTEYEEKIRLEMFNQLKNCPIPNDDILPNLGLFLNSKNLARILFMDHLYKKIVDTHGVVMEFGTRWGQNVALFSALRGIYEPFNRIRKIIGFDTFTGFPELTKEDNENCPAMHAGGLSCTDNYEDYLDKIMQCQEQDNPLNHIKKYELIKGDATKTLKQYLKDNPETIISLAYFDFDIYQPTKECLELVKPHLTKGSVLGFDELCDRDSPGETIALAEVFGLNNIKLERFRYSSRVSYFKIR